MVTDPAFALQQAELIGRSKQQRLYDALEKEIDRMIDQFKETGEVNPNVRM